MESKFNFIRGKDKTVYLLGLSPTLVNDLQGIADDNNEPLNEVIFSALTLYTQLCDEVRNNRRVAIVEKERDVVIHEYVGFFKED